MKYIYQYTRIVSNYLNIENINIIFNIQYIDFQHFIILYIKSMFNTFLIIIRIFLFYLFTFVNI